MGKEDADVSWSASSKDGSDGGPERPKKGVGDIILESMLFKDDAKEIGVVEVRGTGGDGDGGGGAWFFVVRGVVIGGELTGGVMFSMLLLLGWCLVLLSLVGLEGGVVFCLLLIVR